MKIGRGHGKLFLGSVNNPCENMALHVQSHLRAPEQPVEMI